MADTPWVHAALAENGALLHGDGTITVFHRTTAEAAAEIRRTGRMTGEENGLFFSTRGDDAAQAARHGPVAVELRLPLPWLELDVVFGDEAHLRWPLLRPGVRVHVGPYLIPPAPAPRCITVHIITDNDHQYARVRQWLESYPPDQDPEGRHYDTEVYVTDSGDPDRHWSSSYDGAANNNEEPG